MHPKNHKSLEPFNKCRRKSARKVSKHSYLFEVSRGFPFLTGPIQILNPIEISHVEVFLSPGSLVEENMLIEKEMN